MTTTSRAYVIRVSCRNCGALYAATIPVRHAISDHPCKTCGCATLNRESFAIAREAAADELRALREGRA